LFTRALRPGVGLAEEPNTGESFGMNRCRLVAEGIADAWRRGDQSLPGREAAIAARFTAAGCDLSRPHLSPDSADLPEIAQEVDFSHV
jgi:hypothetical protein